MRKNIMYFEQMRNMSEYFEQIRKNIMYFEQMRNMFESAAT